MEEPLPLLVTFSQQSASLPLVNDIIDSLERRRLIPRKRCFYQVGNARNHGHR